VGRLYGSKNATDGWIWLALSYLILTEVGFIVHHADAQYGPTHSYVPLAVLLAVWAVVTYVFALLRAKRTAGSQGVVCVDVLYCKNV